MKTRDGRLLAGLGLAVLVAGGCAGMIGPKAKMRPTNTEVRILSQSCFQGEIEPCGWHGRKGGLARRAAFIDSLRNLDQPILLVDGGDFMLREREREPESKLTWTNMSTLHYDAVSLGEIELSQVDVVRKLMAESPLPLVNTNVEVLENGVWKPLGQRSLVVDLHGVKVGFLSLISENEASPAALGTMATDVRILPPTETAAAVAAELRKKTDVVVLLAHVDGKTMEEYASALPDVDVIVGGHVTVKDEGPLEVGKVIVNRSGTRGQNVSSTRLIVAPDGRIVDFGGINVTLGPGFREDSTVLAQVTAVKEEAARLREEKMKQTRERMQQKSQEQQAGQAAPAATPVPPPAANPAPPAPPQKTP